MKNVSLNRGDICFYYVMPGDTTPAVIVIGRSIQELGFTKNGMKLTFKPSERGDPAFAVRVGLEIEFADGTSESYYIYVQQDKHEGGVWSPRRDFMGEHYTLVNTDLGTECDVVQVAHFVHVCVR